MKIVIILILINIINSLNVDYLNFNLKKNSLMISHILNKNSLNKFNLLLPENQIITKSKVFGNDKLDYRIYYNIFQVNTEFFQGDRFEIITISKNKFTNQLSFVILDCFTNSITWDPLNNIQPSNININKNLHSNKYNLQIKTNKILNQNLLLKLSSTKSLIYKQTLKDFTITPNYKCFFKNYYKPFYMDFNSNLNLTVQLLKDVNLINNLYINDIKKTEHFFIYPNSMNFRVKIN